MCRHALEAAGRPDEQNKVLEVLARYPSPETLRVAVLAAQTPGLKAEATQVAAAIGRKIGGDSPEVRELLAQVGIVPLKVEILKAQYGAGATQRDVTETLRKLAHDSTTIVLPEAYNASFGGDPAAGVKKKLKIEYRIDGKAGEATFAENAADRVARAEMIAAGVRRAGGLTSLGTGRGSRQRGVDASYVAHVIRLGVLVGRQPDVFPGRVALAGRLVEQGQVQMGIE